MQAGKVIVGLVFFYTLQVSFFLFYINVNGQNLVSNPGFENYNFPPNRDGNFSAIKDWKNASGVDATDYKYGTPDFFHKDGTGAAAIPKTRMGMILPYMGSGVVGLVSYNGEIENFREYIYVVLKAPLQVGKEYTVSLALSNGFSQQYGRYSSDGLGLYFSKQPLKQEENELLEIRPQISLEAPFCSSGWEVKKYSFIPDQAYTFLTIGNFKSDAATELGNCFNDITNNYAYLLIDEVSVSLKDENPVRPKVEQIIKAVNDVEVVEEKSVEIDVTANDIYPDKSEILICELGKPTNGLAFKRGDKIIYTPFPDFDGQDSFTYSICTSTGNQSTAMVTVTVNKRELPPLAVDDYLSFTGNQISICVLDNDTDPANLPLSIKSFSLPGYGKVQLSENCLIYNYEGDGPQKDVFNYTIINEAGLSSTATVFLTIEKEPEELSVPIPVPVPPNAPPVANDDLYFSQGEAISICPKSNDLDPDGDPIRILEIGTLNFGRLDRIGDCFQYIPQTKVPAKEQFTYIIADEKGGIAEALVVIEIEPVKVNMPPVARPDFAYSAGEAVEIMVLNNDFDPDRDSISIVENTTPLYGKLELSGSTFTYIPKDAAVGTDSFSYTISDAAGEQSTAIVNIELKPKLLAGPVSTELDGYAYNHITFLIDVSRSMEKAERLSKLKQSMFSFVDELRGNDKISIVVFSGRARVICEEIYGNRKKELKAYIKTLGVETRTNIIEGFNLAYRTAEEHLITGGNNRIIIASDGKFTSYETLKEVVNNHKKKDIALTIFCFDEGISKTAQKELTKLSNLGNGNFEIVNPDNSDQMILREAKQVREK